jgi:hypothetical protein
MLWLIISTPIIQWIEEMNTWFDFVPCSHEGCTNLALTNERECWDHLKDQLRFVERISTSGTTDQSFHRWVLAGIKLKHTNLAGRDFSEACLAGANLEGCDLSQANLERANLSGAILRRANLSFANLEFAILGGADLSEANLEHAILRRSNLVGSTARNANCRAAQMFYSRPGNADFSGACFRNADLQRAIFRNARLVAADLAEALGQANFTGADLSKANLLV